MKFPANNIYALRDAIVEYLRGQARNEFSRSQRGSNLDRAHAAGRTAALSAAAAEIALATLEITDDIDRLSSDNDDAAAKHIPSNPAGGAY